MQQLNVFHYADYDHFSNHHQYIYDLAKHMHLSTSSSYMLNFSLAGRTNTLFSFIIEK